MLEVTDLACSRGDFQLFNGLNFTLSAGELLQIKGRNGSGKTSLLRTLCGFLQPDEGKICWHGQSIEQLGEDFYRDLLYLGHHNAIKDDLNAIENLCLSAGLSGIDLTVPQARDALFSLGLKGRVRLPVKVLSQGQRRRVALSRLLVGQAKLWILDEPLTALDVGAVDLIQQLIAGHLANGGAVIYTTHQPLHVDAVEQRSLLLQ